MKDPDLYHASVCVWVFEKSASSIFRKAQVPFAEEMEEASSNPTIERCAVVTGANKGIGLEICRQLASKGIKVILTARDEKRGLDAAANLKNSGLSDVGFHQLDVQDPVSISRLAKFIETQFGKLDILVNNAGDSGAMVDSEDLRSLKMDGEVTGDPGNRLKSVMQQPYEKAEDCLKTNYYGLKHVTEALVPLLKLSNSANIVNVSSRMGQLKCISNEKIKEELRDLDGVTEERVDEILQKFLKDFKQDELEINGWPSFLSAYCVSKAAVNAYTRILAKQFPDFCINCVCPGFVKTDINYNMGILPVEEGAKGPVMLALLPAGSPSGLFYGQMQITTID